MADNDATSCARLMEAIARARNVATSPGSSCNLGCMKPRSRAFLLVLTCAVVFTAVTAFAQTTPTTGLTPPNVTPAVAVVLILSLVLGYLNALVQGGDIEGIVAPKAWLPDLTIVATLLGGFVAYLKSQSPLVINGSTLLYAVVSAFAALLLGAAPGAARKVHKDLPAARLAAKRLAVKTAATVTPTMLFVVFGITICSCTKAQAASDDAVAVDLTNAVCSVAADSPVGQPWTDVICIAAGAVEQGVALLTAPDAGAASTTAPAVASFKSVRLRLPTAQAMALVAASTAAHSSVSVPAASAVHQ
jgi:hypothetical protein